MLVSELPSAKSYQLWSSCNNKIKVDRQDSELAGCIVFLSLGHLWYDFQQVERLVKTSVRNQYFKTK